MRESSEVLPAYDATLTLSLHPDKQQASPRTPDCLRERAIVRRGPSHRVCIARSCCRRSCISGRGSNATILLLTLALVQARLKLGAARSECRHRARVAVAREEEKRGARGKRSVQGCELRIEACDGLK